MLKINDNLKKIIAGAAVFAAAIIMNRFWTGNPNVTLLIYILAFFMLGGDVIKNAARNAVKGRLFNENFLMSIATIGAFLIGEITEAVGVMLFYQIGEYFQDRAVENSKKSISNLMDIRPDYANIKKDGEIVKVHPDTLQPGDTIFIKPGEKIPLDGVVTEGVSMLDTSALTGESVPRKAEVSDTVLSGCVNQTGFLTVKVTKTFGESAVSKIISLVENASDKKAKTENFITTFARYYTPVVVALAALIAAVPPLLFGGEWNEWLMRALILLVISCPCALVLSIPMGFFAGLGRAAKSGILIKGGNYLEAFNSLDTVVFDKTGTLTKGVFKVTEIISANGFGGSELLEYAAYAESCSNHPIALSVMKEYSRRGGNFKFDNELQKAGGYSEIAGRGVSVKLNDKLILAGNQKLMEDNGIVFDESHNAGTKVYVASGGIFAGCIIISDEIKEDSLSAVAALRKRGVKKTVMLTGDSTQIAEIIAVELGIDEVYGGLLPHEKAEKLEIINAQKNPKGKLAFIGDGINDAPVLAMADIGIAM